MPIPTTDGLACSFLTITEKSTIARVVSILHLRGIVPMLPPFAVATMERLSIVRILEKLQSRILRLK